MNCYLKDQCDRTNGLCYKGCKPGWTGETCDQSKTFVSHFKLLYIIPLGNLKELIAITLLSNHANSGFLAHQYAFKYIFNV